jgi:RNA polymerase sigma-70 factor (ECF subfamily)
VQLYDQLMAVAPSPVVELNRAVAVAEMSGADAGLRLVEGLALPQYHVFHAVRADLLRRTGRLDAARAAYETAAELAGNVAERDYLLAQRAACG